MKISAAVVGVGYLAVGLAATACGSVTSEGESDGGQGEVDGGQGEVDGGQGGSDAEVVEADASFAEPEVESISPADGATGVGPDAEIVLVFSVAMDQDSVEEAWTSSLPAEQLSFSWNAAGNELTVVPAEGMPIAEKEGLDPAGLDPIEVQFGLGSGAIDVYGNALPPVDAAFTTMRRLTTELPSVQSLTNSVLNTEDGAVDPPSISVGASNSTNVYWRLLVTFSLPGLPTGASLERAVLRAEQERVSGDPYGKLGNLDVVHISYTELGPNAFQANPHAAPGPISTDATLETKSLEVTEEVEDDYANFEDRSGRSQYRVQFETAVVNDGNFNSATFGSTSAGEYRSTYELDLSFLVE